MARKRMIDPNFWRDEKIGELPFSDRLIFIGLWTYSDDFGVGRANPKLLKADIFPYDVSFRASDFEKSLANLATHKLIQLYTIEGQNYYYIFNFLKYQTINRPSPSTLPLPPDPKTPPKTEIPPEIPAPPEITAPAEAETPSEVEASSETPINTDELNTHGALTEYSLNTHGALTLEYKLREVEDNKKERIKERKNTADKPPECVSVIKPSKNKYGENKNVFLTVEEHKKLYAEFGEGATKLIDDLSYYLASTGKVYKSHYMTILNWKRKEKPKAQNKQIYQSCLNEIPD